MATIGQISDTLRTQLEPRFGSGETRALMRIIFEEVMLLRPIDVIVNPERELPDFIPPKIHDITRRLLADEPIQYILGQARFCGLNLKVNPATLIPRPETAELVDIITDRYRQRRDLRILDLGTGSGCIAIALARALKFPQITAVDISEAALEIARQNAADYRVKINFINADILNLHLPDRFDIIVSNPPYVLDSERAEMEPHVLNHEPHSALFVPDSDPMRFYDAIVQYARHHSKALYFEINPLCAAQFKDAQIIKDSFGKDRFAIYDPIC
ncbi:MAG: peptide chain release factor N(5)-glutamine methyltransferase [Bacteroidales bacterium]|nr:peptide chain release factor N(5)-glutamine methyltransferase [Bacteroidales bacterium]